MTSAVALVLAAAPSQPIDNGAVTAEGANILLGKAGFLLFTIGLGLGTALAKMRNPRMGLSAHLTAVQTGLALIAIAWLWPHLATPASSDSVLACALIASSYCLVSGITLAGITGASKALPIAGAGYSAAAFYERTVSLVVRVSSMVMALSCIAICFFFLTNG